MPFVWERTPFVVEALLQPPYDMQYGMTTIFKALTPHEQRKARTLDRHINQMLQLKVSLLQDIRALRNKSFFTMAHTKHLEKASNTTLKHKQMRFIEQMRSRKFTVTGEIAVRKLVIQKYENRIATLQNEGLALYAKADADLLMRVHKRIYGTDEITHEMQERFVQMYQAVPTSAEMQGRLTLENVCDRTWDGVLRCELQV